MNKDEVTTELKEIILDGESIKRWDKFCFEGEFVPFHPMIYNY